jgi:hypothetical protein
MAAGEDEPQAVVLDRLRRLIVLLPVCCGLERILGELPDQLVAAGAAPDSVERAVAGDRGQRPNCGGVPPALAVGRDSRNAPVRGVQT